MSKFFKNIVDQVNLLISVGLEKKAYIYLFLMIRGALLKLWSVLYNSLGLSYNNINEFNEIYKIRDGLIDKCLCYFQTNRNAHHYIYKHDNIILVVGKLNFIDFLQIQYLFYKCCVRINKSGIFIRLRLSKGWGCVLWENDFPIQILSVKDNGSYFIPENKLARKRYGYINKVWVLDNNKNTEVDECQFDIDMVYTWVDDSDPEWLEKKEACLRLLSNDNSHHVTSFSSSRFKNRDELLFSLRSVEYYAPFIRKIFIVTDGQIPKWLDIKNKKIIIVDHTDIFDDLTHLPTFNSHAIEMHLHRIMGLSDHYIYMNDDFFLRRRVNPSDFFELPNGNTKVFFSSQRIPVENIGLDLLPVDTAAINGQKLLETHFYVKVTNKLKHMPYPQNKPLIKEICSKFNEFTKTSSTKFRSKSDYSLPASFYHHYALLAGKAQKDELPYLYADIGSRHFLSILNYIRFSGKYKSFCINDTGDSSYLPSDKIDKLLDILFNKIYPYKAEFEK